MRNKGTAYFGITVLALAMTAVSLPAQLAASGSGTPDLEGGWLRLDTQQSGSYHGIDLKFPRAELLPDIAKKLPPEMDEGLGPNTAPAGKPHAVGEPYIVKQPGQGGPVGGGGVGVDVNSDPFFMLQSKDEILFMREGPGARHIYIDGRAHPDPVTWVPTSGGHSVGHYENGMLVVDTTGFTTGVTSFGRGWKTPHTHLTERFQLSPDGQTLTIHYKWDDPEVYVKPLEYDISFSRLPKGSYAFESWNDASDPLSYQSIVPPAQLP